jgi:hypothetical protein
MALWEAAFGVEQPAINKISIPAAVKTNSHGFLNELCFILITLPELFSQHLQSWSQN